MANPTAAAAFPWQRQARRCGLQVLLVLLTATAFAPLLPTASARSLQASGSGSGGTGGTSGSGGSGSGSGGGGRGGGGGGGGLNPLPSGPLASPFGDPRQICPANGQVVLVDGFPSSPFAWVPFQKSLILPPRYTADNATGTFVRADGHRVNSYHITARSVDLDLTCPQPTTFLGYDAFVPGPTFRVNKGDETIVRIINDIVVPNPSMPNLTQFEPCDVPGRSGRPMTTHHHGSASLAPFDGWAEDETCFGEAKDYVYPVNRDATEWYHDHALDITADNVYYGLAGFFTVVDPCGSPWNLDGLPDWEMIFQDKVLNSQCQLYYDFGNGNGPHKNNLYGDMNLVNGIPWPVADLEPRYYHFRWLGGGPSRPWKLQLAEFVNGRFREISSRFCWVVGGDGGYKEQPSEFPREGMQVGVAERYEVVCDLRSFSNKDIYLINVQAGNVQKDVPFFCYSHLMVKMRVGACTHPMLSGVCQTPIEQNFQPELQPQPIPVITDVISDAVFAEAQARVAAKDWDRNFAFGRSNGQWVINNENWFTARVAADHVGQNTYEIWRLEAGGWFHPVHIHLVDFYVMARNDDPALVPPFEWRTPKDVVMLGPSGSVTLLIRFGPHKGEYMFHCHNLDHEDHVMMRSFNVTARQTGLTAPTATTLAFNPTVMEINNVIYDIYADPKAPPVAPRPLATFPPLNDPAYLANQTVVNAYYRIFYTSDVRNASDPLLDPSKNPWLTRYTCKAPFIV